MIAILLTIGCAIFWQPIVGFDQKSSSEELETITTKEYKFNRHVTDLRNKTMANLCFCSMGEHACDVDEHTCLKDSDAACFHSIRLEYNANQKQMEIVHHFGCAPFERGGNGSHLTCNAHRSPHARPYSIACCYEGNYCNRNIIPPNFSNFNVDQQYETDEILDRREIIIYFIIFMVIGFIILVAFYCVTRKWLTSYKRSKDELNLLEKKGDNFFLSSSSINSDSDGKCSEESSGAGYATLNQRTVAQYLTFLSEIASGRYGCVQQAYYRTRLVAVKTFYTKDEESWRNEKDIYLTQMLNHENILQFVAADICSVDSVTKMLLITDYHPFGSLYDYLKQRNHIYLDEALKLALTSVLGLEHLHTKVFGTSCKYKPEIAHRDIKSKNIIVKQPGICCLADFGLAVRIENGIIKPPISNPQAGTRRYMSPEVLSNTLNPINFDEFKKSDIYSLSLVFWEIFKRVRITEQFESIHRRNSSGSSTESGIAPSASSENSNPLDHCSARLENMPLMSSSTDSGHCSDGNINTMPYELSYSGMVSSDPTIEEMRNLVCVEKKRPPIPNDWSNNPEDSFCKLKVLMTEMWSSNPVSRHTALKVKIELDKIISALSPSKGHSTYLSETQYSASSSGFGSAKQTNT